MTEFVIKRQDPGSLDSIVISNQTAGLCLKVLPGYGGNIAELTLAVAGESLTVIDGYQNSEAALAHKGYFGALLFPFPNRISDGHYSFEGREYQLPINRPKENCAIHGLFTHQSFEVVSQQTDDQFAEFSIKTVYNGAEAGYPFPCEVTLSYRLSSSGEFQSTVSVRNCGESNMPVAFGWHPYFSLGCPADELKLRLPTADILLTDQKNIPTGHKAPMTPFNSLEPIACSLFDTAFELKGANCDDTMVVTEILNMKDRWQLSLSQSIGSGGYNYLQLYIPPDRKTIALEPMTAPANSFNSGTGLMSLAPEQTTNASFTVSLNRTDK